MIAVQVMCCVQDDDQVLAASDAATGGAVSSELRQLTQKYLDTGRPAQLDEQCTKLIDSITHAQDEESFCGYTA